MRMNPGQEAQLLRRVLNRLDADPSATRLTGIDMVVIAAVLLLSVVAVVLLEQPGFASIAALSSAFVAGLAIMLWWVKKGSAMQWQALAPHVDRESIESRLRDVAGTAQSDQGQASP